MLERQVNHRLSPDARMQFAPSNGVAFFEPTGWSATVVRSLLLEAARHERLPLLLRPFALLPEPDPTHPGERPWSCVMRMDRAQPPAGAPPPAPVPARR